VRAGIALAFLCITGTAAHADDNDLVLGRLATRVTDGSGNLTNVVGQNLELRSLASQLGVVLAPHLLTPADTLGFGGFQLTVDYATTTIDSSASYWRVLESSPDPGGTGSTSHGQGTMRTVGFFARKGLWFPVPSLEVGGGAVHLVDSHTWTGQLYTKLALHEGYHQLPLPSLAVRGAVSRMMNQRELDLTVASIDIALSKHVGIGSTWRLDPFAGWNVLVIVPRSEVIDPTPNIDPLSPEGMSTMDIEKNFVFKDQDAILRNRFFFGAKLQYYVFQLTLEAQFATAGSSIDDRSGTSDSCMPNSMTTSCDAKDTAASQRTLSMSAGFDF
jgi:hypothetical protein